MRSHFAVLVVSWVLCTCEAKNAIKINPKTLDARLAEATYLPLRLSCPKKYQHILLGGITFNRTDVPPAVEATAKQQCTEQLANTTMQAKFPDETICSITFGRNVSIQQTGVIRMVYKCAMSALAGSGASPWMKGMDSDIYETILVGKQLKFMCPGKKQIIKVKEVTKHGEAVGKDQLTAYQTRVLRDCYKQMIEELKKRNSQNVKCDLVYANALSDDLRIKYQCVEPLVRKPGSTFVSV